MWEGVVCFNRDPAFLKRACFSFLLFVLFVLSSDLERQGERRETGDTVETVPADTIMETLDWTCFYRLSAEKTSRCSSPGR